MPEIFEIKLPTGETLKGYHWPAPSPKANMTMITGMQEYALRYDPLAKFLNENGVNVWILDAFGQGLNAESVETQQRWPKGNAFAKQVDAIHLMNQMAKENGLPLTQVGHSMGSFMTQSRLERYPHSSDRTILIGSNGGQGALMSIASALSSMIFLSPEMRLTSYGILNMTESHIGPLPHKNPHLSVGTMPGNSPPCRCVFTINFCHVVSCGMTL